MSDYRPNRTLEVGYLDLGGCNLKRTNSILKTVIADYFDGQKSELDHKLEHIAQAIEQQKAIVDLERAGIGHDKFWGPERFKSALSELRRLQSLYVKLCGVRVHFRKQNRPGDYFVHLIIIKR